MRTYTKGLWSAIREMSMQSEAPTQPELHACLFLLLSVMLVLVVFLLMTPS